MRVIVGITGGIAAYKATGIIRQLTEAGHTVKVIPTPNALRFIGAATLEALSHNAVDPDLYTDIDSVKHVALGKEADLVIVAPATASFIARYAAGIADDLLGNTLLVTQAPVVIAPAMHSEMWNHPATQNNIEILKQRGVRVLDPASGRLTGTDSGVGRLPEPEEIISFALGQFTDQALAGKTFVITAGGTREAIDPVRYIGNKSSGKQGIAIAQEAAKRGATVKLIAANISENISQIAGSFDSVTQVTSAEEMQAALYDTLYKIPSNSQGNSQNHVDCLIMAAAVADFRVEEPAQNKIKKSDTGETVELKLVANPDILAGAVKLVAAENLKTVTVGFAAETALDDKQLESFALKKITDKGCDLLVANNVSGGKVFDADTNSVFIFNQSGRVATASGEKSQVAAELLDIISGLLNK